MTVLANDLAEYMDAAAHGCAERVTGRSCRLSAREVQVVQGLATGDSTEQIGLSLTMSPHTVRTHLRNIMRKLEARTRAHAVAIAIGDGAVQPPAY